MNAKMHKLSFAKLAEMNNGELDSLMAAGAAPALEEVAGFEFRGWNNNAATKLFGTRKFKKGFFGEPSRGYL